MKCSLLGFARPWLFIDRKESMKRKPEMNSWKWNKWFLMVNKVEEQIWSRNEGWQWQMNKSVHVLRGSRGVESLKVERWWLKLFFSQPKMRCIDATVRASQTPTPKHENIKKKVFLKLIHLLLLISRRRQNSAREQSWENHIKFSAQFNANLWNHLESAWNWLELSVELISTRIDFPCSFLRLDIIKNIYSKLSI